MPQDPAEHRIATLLGFAQAAGKLALGETAVQKALAQRRAYLVILARDAGESTQRRFSPAHRSPGPAVVAWGTKEQLGHIVGRDAKAVLAVLDGQMATAIRKALTEAGGATRARPEHQEG